MSLEFTRDSGKATAKEMKHAFLAIPSRSPSMTRTIRIMRFVASLMGRSLPGRLLVVVHTEIGTRIRPISARLATPRESRDDEQS